MSDNNEVCETLLQVVRRARKSRLGPAAAAATPVALLLSSKLRSAQREIDELLAADATAKSGVPLVISIADSMAARRDAADVPPLQRISESSVFHDNRGVRRAVVYALTQIPSKEAVDVLIGMLDRVGGEARADASEYLAQVTGQVYAMDAGAWQRWWKESKTAFAYPSVTVRRTYREGMGEGSSGNYYEMPIFAERIVFVLDNSGSMSGPRIDAAKRELIRAISELPENAQFGVVVFNSIVTRWHHDLVAADAKAKRGAISFVANLQTTGSTASYDALQVAFGFDTEAIYFLSDGAPNFGKVRAPGDIVASVTEANRARRISIYTIGVGAGFPGSPLDVFLRTLGETNLGQYRRVDN